MFIALFFLISSFKIFFTAFPIPSFELNLQVVFMSYEDGIVVRKNYLYNHRYVCDKYHLLHT